MSRKDYEAIAKAFHNGVERADGAKQLGALLGVAEEIATHSKDANPRFDRARFMLACGFAADVGVR